MARDCRWTAFTRMPVFGSESATSGVKKNGHTKVAGEASGLFSIKAPAQGGKAGSAERSFVNLANRPALNKIVTTEQ